jgi:hypothetical protein
VAEDVEDSTEDPAEVVEVMEGEISKPDRATGLAPILPAETTTSHGETPAINAAPSALKAVGEMAAADLEEEAAGEETEDLEGVVEEETEDLEEVVDLTETEAVIAEVVGVASETEAVIAEVVGVVSALEGPCGVVTGVETVTGPTNVRRNEKTKQK